MSGEMNHEISKGRPRGGSGEGQAVALSAVVGALTPTVEDFREGFTPNPQIAKVKYK